MLSVDEDGDVKVVGSGDMWTFNPLCLEPENIDTSMQGATMPGISISDILTLVMLFFKQIISFKCLSINVL